MAKSNRNASTGSASTILLVAVAAIAAVQAVALVGLFRRVSELEAREPAAAGPGPAAPAAEGVARAEIEAQVRAIVDERIAAAAKTHPATADGEAAAAPMAPGALEEKVKAIVDQQIAAMPKNAAGEWKPTIGELSADLELSDYQETQAVRILDDAKQEAFAVASIPREDGGSKADDLVAAVTDPVDPEAATRQFFLSLFSEKIPGREETYIVELLRIKSRTEENLLAILDDGQRKKLRSRNVDYLGVKTSYDPFVEHIQASAR